ncbi:MAG: hydrogenase iron-sulfur subunit [Candidatus Njordarchaeia archaeon]
MSKEWEPKLLVISTNLISDLAIDMTGLMHKHYPPSTSILRIPCSSMVRPDIILYAFKQGFDGVFIAADGTDCPYTEECVEKTGKRTEEAFELIKKHGIEPERLKMAAICSVCVKPFLHHVKELYDTVKKLGPVKVKEG